MPFKLRAPEPGEAGLRRELYFLALFRVLEAGLLAFAAVNSSTLGAFGVRNAGWTSAIAFGYLAASCAMFLLAGKTRWPLRQHVAVGISVDLVVFVAALHNINGLNNGIALLMLFNVAASALLLSLRWSLIVAALAGFALVGEFVYAQLALQIVRSLPETAMFAVTYLAAALFANLLGRQLRASEVLAEQRGAEVDNLARVNEMIIRRMRTGLLAVGADNSIRLFNEAAWYLLGNPSPERRMLADVAPDLWRRLRSWRQQQKPDSTPLTLAPDTPSVIPRFTALGGGDELTLIFLDDTSLLSRRAEELTLTTLGRLAASIAHEIRNPLAAISHSAQLLRESQIEPATDQRLVEIINSQCQRMDGIVQNVLGLARRDRSQPESLELGAWAQHFIADFQQNQPDHGDQLRVTTPSEPVRAMMDPQQLQQVVTVLVQNALAYGRMPGEPARVSLVAHYDKDSGGPMLDVVDRGPGIPTSIAERLFQPFFTTSEHGTGLGLYIARQLCEANQASLDYIPLPGGGCCFRIVMTRTEPLARSAPPLATGGG
jgi:two-component system sensor histidine kinase PilS (NtrC family)